MKEKAKVGVHTTDVIGEMPEFCAKVADAISADVECPSLKDSPALIDAIARVVKGAGAVLEKHFIDQLCHMPSEEDFTCLIESMQHPPLSTFEFALDAFLNHPEILGLDHAKVLCPMLCDRPHRKVLDVLVQGYEKCAGFVAGMHEVASLVITALGQSISSEWSPSTPDGAKWWGTLIADKLRLDVTHTLARLVRTNYGTSATTKLGEHANSWIKSQLELRMDSDPRPPIQLPHMAMHRNLRHFVLRVRETAQELSGGWTPGDFSDDTLERALKKPAGRLAKYLAHHTERQYARYYINALIDDILMKPASVEMPALAPAPAKPPLPIPVKILPSPAPAPAPAPIPTPAVPKKRGRPPTKNRASPPSSNFPRAPAVVDLTEDAPPPTVSAKGKEPLHPASPDNEDDAIDILDTSDDTYWSRDVITSGTGGAGIPNDGGSSSSSISISNGTNNHFPDRESTKDGGAEALEDDEELRERLADCPITMEDLRKKDAACGRRKYKNPLSGYAMCDRCTRLAFYKCTMDICKTYDYCTRVSCACCFESSFSIGNAGLTWNPMLQNNSSSLYTGRMSIKLCDDCKSNCTHGWELGADGELEHKPPNYRIISSARGCKLCPTAKPAAGKRPREDTVCYECRECETRFCSRIECDPDMKFLRQVYLPMEDRFITRAILRLPPDAQDLARLALAEAEDDLARDGAMIPAAGVGCRLPRSLMERKILPLELNLRCLCREYHGSAVHGSETDSCLAKFLDAVHAVAAEELKIRDRWMNMADKGARLGGTINFNAPKHAMTYQMFSPSHNGHQVVGLGLDGEDIFVGLLNMRAIATNDSELISIVERMRANDGYTTIDSDTEDDEPAAKRQCTPQNKAVSASI